MRIPFLLVLGMSSAAHAAEFFTSFEDQNQRTAGTFTVTDGELSATFAGGTAFTIGNGALYRTGGVSWMLDPAGSSSRGESDGTGTATLSEPAERVLAFIRNENAQTSARLQVIDGTGAVVRESAANSNGWTRVEHSIVSGEAELVSLRLINDGGGMVALDDFEFSTAAAGGGDPGPGGGGPGGGGGGSGAAGMLCLLLSGAGLLSARRRGTAGGTEKCC